MRIRCVPGPLFGPGDEANAEPAGADSALLGILDMSSSHSPAIMRDHK